MKGKRARGEVGKKENPGERKEKRKKGRHEKIQERHPNERTELVLNVFPARTIAPAAPENRDLEHRTHGDPVPEQDDPKVTSDRETRP